MQKITPFLWYNGNVEEAMNFYTSIFNDSKVIASSGMSATIQINGQELILFNGGPTFNFNPAFSLFIHCKTQEEVDYYWNKLLEGGGEPSRCGWLKDKFGLSWQVIPEILGQALQHKDREKAQKAMNAMLQMSKIDVSKLEEAVK